MLENATKLAFMEGPQGVGKTSAVQHAATIGYRPVRGIPIGEKLVTNSTAQIWKESLDILDLLARQGEHFVSDRSFWSLVVYKMRKRPEFADSFYERGSHVFKDKLDGVDHKVIVIFAEPQTCLLRANPDSPVAITDLKESEDEAKAYKDLLLRLKDDGFKAVTIYNEGISRDKFRSELESHLIRR